MIDTIINTLFFSFQVQKFTRSYNRRLCKNNVKIQYFPRDSHNANKPESRKIYRSKKRTGNKTTRDIKPHIYSEIEQEGCINRRIYVG